MLVVCLLACACATVVGLDKSDCAACDGGAPPAKPGSEAGVVAPVDPDGATSGPCATCVKPPDGWTPVLLIDPANACPASGTSDIVLANPKPSGQCTCSCGTAPNPCLDAKTRSITVRTGSVGCNDGDIEYNTSGNCFTMSVADNVNGGSASHPAPAKIACPATVAVPAVGSDAKYKACALPTGGACATGEVCRESKVCLSHAGAVPCPPDFTKAIAAVTEAEAADPKACGACTCTTNATSCTGSELTLYGQPNCGGNSIGKLPVSNSCSAGGGNGNAVSARFVSTPNPTGCTPSAPTAMDLPASRTICCAP